MKKDYKNAKKVNGFSTIELMVVVAIVAILVSVAVPSMQSMTKKRQVSEKQRAITSTLSFARGEAVSRSTFISACPDSGNETPACANSADWSNGWLVFVDYTVDGGGNGNGSIDDGEEVLRAVNPSSSATVAFRPTNASGDTVSNIIWDYRGQVYEYVGGDEDNPGSRDPRSSVAVICEIQNDNRFARAVMLDRSGRTHQSRDSDNDGTHDIVTLNDNGEAGNAASIACATET